jgi:hypothetical protein
MARRREASAPSGGPHAPAQGPGDSPASAAFRSQARPTAASACTRTAWNAPGARPAAARVSHGPALGSWRATPCSQPTPTLRARREREQKKPGARGAVAEDLALGPRNAPASGHPRGATVWRGQPGTGRPRGTPRGSPASTGSGKMLSYATYHHSVIARLIGRGQSAERPVARGGLYP